MNRWDVINRIAQLIGATRYLEIGTANGDCLEHVDIAIRAGVDPTPKESAVRASTVFYPLPSDEFFARAPSLVAEPFDVVFIDGWHQAWQAYRDVRGSLRLLSPRGVVVLHDCSPADEFMQWPWPLRGDWTGDVWKAIVRLRDEGEHDVRVIDCDYGIGVVIPNRQLPSRNGSRRNSPTLRTPADLTWADLDANREELLGLLPTDGWEDWFSPAWARAHPLDVG